MKTDKQIIEEVLKELNFLNKIKTLLSNTKYNHLIKPISLAFKKNITLTIKKCKECIITKSHNPKYPICNYHQGYYKGYQETKEEFNKKLEQIKQLIESMIRFREGEEKNNNIFRKSVDDLNEDFIDALSQLKKEIEYL